MKKPEYVIWDWNGTLFNDVDVCISVQNIMLKERKLPEIESREYYYRVFTFPIIQYYRNLGYDLAAERFEDICGDYIAHYERDMLQCGLYSGALPLMRRLREWGIGQAVISAASKQSLRKQMQGKGIEKLLDAAIGIDDDLAESKTENARAYVRELAIAPRDILFVGDSLHDEEVARECGCGCALIAYGHQDARSLTRSGAPVYANPEELDAALQKLFGGIA